VGGGGETTDKKVQSTECKVQSQNERQRQVVVVVVVAKTIGLSQADKASMAEPSLRKHFPDG